jgi:hypothetical protein
MNEVPGRTGRAASAFGKPRLPRLSPAFVTEEDAAYWAHTQIPVKPDREYGSVIMLRPDGLFVATEPVSGSVDRFDFGTIIEVDARGSYVQPQGYRCVANLHNHAPLYKEVRNANPGVDEFHLRLFINFFSYLDFVADVAARGFFPSAYLSGPDGVLLKYSPSGSKEEWSYSLWRQAGSPPGNPVGTYDIVSTINKFAAVGDLRVIVSNADWGYSVGRVPSDWKAGKAFSGGEVTELPLMTRVCANAERAVLAALKFRDAKTSGLVLRSHSGKHYVATHARPAGLAAWDPHRLFPAGSDGQPRLPRGYVLEGFYYGSRPDPGMFPPTQHWLYENFFTPQEMALAIACNTRWQQLSAPGQSLSLYMLALDASMLKYTFSGSRIEAGMSVESSDGTIHDAGLQARLRNGALLPREYVSVVMLAGRLQVLRGSALWARLGLVDDDWKPFANFPWPVLSQEFLTADDAVRYAHEQIDPRRDRQYAGYVLQRDNRRFVVTEPLEGDIATLSRGDLYPKDNKGRPVLPDSHLLHARYVSHVALSELDSVDVASVPGTSQDTPGNPIDSDARPVVPSHLPFEGEPMDHPTDAQPAKWTRNSFAMSLQMVSVDESRQVFMEDIPLYVSAGQDGLVRFEPSTTQDARDFQQRLGTTGNPGPLAKALETRAILPEAFIRLQASAGRLTVLLDSDLWGPRGDITPAWRSPDVPQAWKRPGTVAFGAVCASADDASVYRYAREARLYDTERAWFGFILKHVDREEYVATELFPVDEHKDNVFQLASMFAWRSGAPWFQFPEGFGRHALFYSRQRVKHPSSRSLSWLAQYFIPPQDLSLATYDPNRRPVVDPIQGALYMSTQDGALLRYERSDASRLFKSSDPELSLAAINQKLARRRMLPEEFVRLVANSGELYVLRTSACWDRAGRVNTTWKPRMNLERRWLSPVFQSPDDAVVYMRSLITGSAIKPFGGLILKRSDGLYMATAPLEVSREDFDIAEIYPDQSEKTGLFPSGCRVMARYRSRVARGMPVLLSSVEKQVYLNMLSVDTLYTAFTRASPTALDEYLLSPDGSVICYRSGLLDRIRAGVANVLTDYKGLPADLDGKKIRQFIHTGELKPGVWIDSLAKAGNLRVIVGGDLWGLPRLVMRWVPFSTDLLPPSDYHKAASDPVCSPLFIQADDAARYTHESEASRRDQTFGFILRSGDGSFIATLPIEVQRSSLALDRVFVQGRLLAGFSLEAVYIRAAYPPIGARDDDIRHFFISPNDMYHARVQAFTHQGYKSIYISCTDGALLKLTLDAFEPGVFYDRHGQIELRPNMFASADQAAQDERDIAKGTFIFSDYVRRMSRAGKLEVIETSAHWSRHGSVGDDWRPRMVDVSVDERWRANPAPALGPVFQHADDAALHACERMDDEPDTENGYEGAILAKAGADRHVPLEPVAYSAYEQSPLVRIFRTARDADTSWTHPVPSFPDGYKLVAAHQFHLSANTTLVPDPDAVHANFASPDQVHAHTHELKNKGFAIRDYYYSTPDGALLKYTPVYSDAERHLLLTKPVVFEKGRWVSKLSPGQFISKLVELGEFRVLVPGHYWKQTGGMGTGWKTLRQQPMNPGVVRPRDEL